MHRPAPAGYHAERRLNFADLLDMPEIDIELTEQIQNFVREAWPWC